jgi:tellurite methyltransferase
VTSEQLMSAIVSKVPIVDIRDVEDFNALHLKSSANIPWQQYFERLSELPDPAKDFIIVANDEQVLDVELMLESRRHKPSLIISWQTILNKGLHSEVMSTGCSCTQLWSANPLLSEFLLDFTMEQPKPVYIDLGCGAGRELVHMAQHGFRAIGYDRMPDCKQRAQSLAASSETLVEVLQEDIEADSFNPELQAHVISVFRFLHRPLLKKIDSWLTPKGFIVYQTFMQGCEKLGSPKNPNYLLKPNELADTFSNFDIKVNRIDYLADGRPMQSFIAQKR